MRLIGVAAIITLAADSAGTTGRHKGADRRRRHVLIAPDMALLCAGDARFVAIPHD
jgi:hypothetical protein